MTQQALNSTDSSDYLKRIRFSATPGADGLGPTLPTLQALHRAHMLAVPFEDLSIHIGQPIILQEDALFDKIVRRRRGGFCYELNGLFAALLRHLGYRVTLLSAGVARSAGGFGPEFDHLTLLVHQLAGADWLADVGFGDSFVQPLRFEEGLEQDGGEGRRYRLAQERPGTEAGNGGSARSPGVPAGERPGTPQSGGTAEAGATGDYWLMQQFNGEQWEAQYRFTLQPHALSDFIERCYYFQHSPESHFLQNRMCSLATSAGRITLSGGGRPGAVAGATGARSTGDPAGERPGAVAGATPQSRGTASGLKLITTVNGQREEQALASEEEYQRVLAERFGIVL